MISALSYTSTDLTAPNFSIRYRKGKTLIGGLLSPCSHRPWFFVEDSMPVLQNENHECAFIVCLFRLGRIPRPLTYGKKFCSIRANDVPVLNAYLERLEDLLTTWAKEKLSNYEFFLVSFQREGRIYFSYSESSHFDIGECRGILSPCVIESYTCKPILLRLSWWANLQKKLIGLRLHIVRCTVL